MPNISSKFKAPSASSSVIPGFETREFVWFDVPLRRISVQTAHFGQSRWLLFPVVSLFVSGKEKTSETSSKMQGILHSENQEVELFRGFWNDFRSWRWLFSSYWELFECPIESPANHWVVWEYNIYVPPKKASQLLCECRISRKIHTKIYKIMGPDFDV